MPNEKLINERVSKMFFVLESLKNYSQILMEVTKQIYLIIVIVLSCYKHAKTII